MSFVAQCIQDSRSIWEACLNTPFLRQLEAGTLKPDCFLGYVIEDSLYRREYAKVFAWGMTKAKDMNTIRVYYSMLSFLNESEDATRLQYLAQYGLSDETIQHLPLRPENQAYVDCMIRAARQGEGAPECMMAALPCMLSYSWIFKRLLARSPSVRETAYWPLVRDYADSAYDTACAAWTDYTDAICADLTPQRRTQCMEIFRACSQHELCFWKMSQEPRTDVALG